MKRIVMFFCVLSVFIHTGCSSEEQSTEAPTPQPTQQETEEKVEQSTETEQDVEEPQLDSEQGEMRDPFENLLERAPEEPTTVEELLHYPTGPLANMTWRDDRQEILMKVKEVLPPIEKETSEQELEAWWRAFRYLFAREYPNPDQYFTEFTISGFGGDGVIDERYQFKEQINVLVVLDVSGSMRNEIDGKPMMDIAKEAIQEFTSNLPEKANVGLRVYGHEGKSTGADKSQSCQSTELVYDIQPLKQSEFDSILHQFEPTGWTPIALSLEEAMKDFEKFPGEENTNLVYVVSDGIETCDGNPEAAAKALADSNIQPIINVIGFNVDMDGQQHLREIAEAGNGLYTNAGNEEQLKDAFEQAEELIRQWEQWLSGNKIDARNQRARLLNKARGLQATWTNENMGENRDLREVKVALSTEGYITREASHYFTSLLNEKNRLYQGFSNEVSERFEERVEEAYEKTIEELEETFTENTPDE
ncbi:VWA domain-containing protein [Alkalihalobacterium bogoriense]|uniref:VWA domain-containing protein n=1 Tax=Alkalihalobacterium bogoriense TaxID=246272 RepID=UPI0006889155|nr:VWA domain-containing protein [Alkalihalobacterium bogoriense]